MDLDELKQKAKDLRAPGCAASSGKADGARMERLIASLRTEDERDRNRARRMMIFFGIASVLYLLIFSLTWIFPPDGPPGNSRLALGIFAAAFFGIAIASRRAWRERTAQVVGKSGESVRASLERAKKQYGFIETGTAILAIPFLMALTLGASSAWSSAAARYLPDVDPSIVMGAFWIFWALMLPVALLLGWLDWKKRKWQIREEVKALLGELSREEKADEG